MWKFSVIWFGQLISLIGSGLATFAFGIGELLFLDFFFFSALPYIFVSPLAGAIVHRHNI